jgi:Protein of unknown function (DUF2786)
MPDQVTIQRIAKLLARATSPEAGEAQAALEGAFKRMKRDGVSFTDLLTLPTDDLYQDVLVKLVSLLLADQPNLSPAGRREAYARYMQQIVAKFSGDWDGNQAGQGSGGGQNQQDDDREAAARAYEERRRAEEAARERDRARAGASQQAGSQQSRPNAQESPGQPSKTYTWSWKGKTFSFSPAAFQAAMQPVWGRGSILWLTLHDPTRGFRLLAASMLWGMGFAVALIALAALAHAVTDTDPLWDVQLKSLFLFLAVVGAIWKVIMLLHDRQC